MRSIWTGAIGFGLVNIPIKMYSATQDSNLDLDMLDKKDHAHIRFKRVNEDTGKEVPWENIVKGYKLDDRYIVLTDEDFEKASPEKSKIIGINEFVDEREIDGIYYETHITSSRRNPVPKPTPSFAMPWRKPGRSVSEVSSSGIRKA